MRYASRLGLLALLCLLGAWQSPRPLAPLLAWSALSFAWISLAYVTRRPRLLGKRADGKIGALPALALAPYHALNAVSYALACAIAREDAADEIVPGLWLSRRLSWRDSALLASIRPHAVLDAAAEMPELSALRPPRTTYLSLPVLDTTAPSTEELQAAAAWIESQMSHGPVVVHCALGHGRSATLVAAFLMLSSRALTADDALSMIRARRPLIELSPEQTEALQVLARSQAAIFW